MLSSYFQTLEFARKHIVRSHFQLLKIKLC